MSDLVQSLYPIFKEEVFRRASRIAGGALSGAAGMVIGMFWFARVSETFSTAERGLCAAAVGVFSAGLVFFIEREGSRHAGAKTGLIRLEQALGVFEAGRHVPGESLFPAEWRTAPPPGRAVRGAQALVLATAALFVIELMLVR